MLWFANFLNWLMIDIIIALIAIGYFGIVSHATSGTVIWLFVVAAVFISAVHSTIQASKQFQQIRTKEQMVAFGLCCRNCHHLTKSRFFGRLSCKFKRRTSENDRCEKHSEYEELLQRYREIEETARRQHDEIIAKGVSSFAEMADSKARSKPTNKRACNGNKVSDPMGELASLIGIETVKNEIRKLKALLWVHKQREKKQLQVSKPSLHMVFTGGPGTGKTTVARIVGALYKELVLLSKGHLVEVDRAGLVAGYVGQTAIKTKEVIDSALGGVLFIDEAYSLTQGTLGGDAFGQECINVLLKSMEDQRENLAVIVAGYPAEMKQFVQSNPGLESRFRRYIHFPDYDTNELVQIFDIMAKSRSYTYGNSVRNVVREYFENILRERPSNFANARHVRNVLDMAEENMALRLQKSFMIPSADRLQKLEPQDVAFLRG